MKKFGLDERDAPFPPPGATSGSGGAHELSQRVRAQLYRAGNLGNSGLLGAVVWTGRATSQRSADLLATSQAACLGALRRTLLQQRRQGAYAS